MLKQHILKRMVAMSLILTLLLSLCACDVESATKSTYNLIESMGISMDVIPGERLLNSPWINSDLFNSIDETTELSLKDDFHAAANREWLLAHNNEEEGHANTWEVASNTLSENTSALLYRDAQFNPDRNIMSEETLQHLQELIWDMVDLADNQEKRNELGLEPLIPYLQTIENIDSLEEMTQYLINSDKTNLTAENFVNAMVDSPVDAKDYYTVFIRYPMHLTLSSPNGFKALGLYDFNLYSVEKEAIRHVLGELGYTPKQIKKVLYNCYTFERAMADYLPTDTEVSEENYWNRAIKAYTLEDLQKLQGNFPLIQLLEAAGVAHSETFRIAEYGFVNFMGKYYKQSHLENLKAYFLVHTILDSLPYLDETCQNWGDQIWDIRNTAATEKKQARPEKPEDPSDEEAMENYRLNLLMHDYIKPLLKVPFELAYIGNFCSSQAKQEIKDIVEQIRAFYVDLLANTQWLSQETRDKAVEKAQKMAVRVMYPDELPDYSNLTYKTYEEGGNLLDAVAAIHQRSHQLPTHKINQPVNRADWNLGAFTTLAVNAFNEHTSNAITIMAGILAGDFMYDPDAPVEQNYGRLGVIVGHEVSHSFDTTGYGYDSEGLPYGWWTNDDVVAFRQRSDRLASYYSKLMYLPRNPTPYTGTTVQGEAISDMGGVKCMLALAEDIPDFDYDLFFRSYASLWAYQTTMQGENEKSHDEHPLGFFRTNVTLQQFDKFFETYGIGPGDGMYLAPEDRILVW